MVTHVISSTITKLQSEDTRDASALEDPLRHLAVRCCMLKVLDIGRKVLLGFEAMQAQ